MIEKIYLLWHSHECSTILDEEFEADDDGMIQIKIEIQKLLKCGVHWDSIKIIRGKELEILPRNVNVDFDIIEG